MSKIDSNTFPISFTVRPACKKSLEEVEVWKNDKGHMFITEVMWRSGEYIVHLNDEDDLQLWEECKDDTDEFVLDNFEHEMVETFDACSEEYSVVIDNVTITDEDNEIIQAYQEDWSDALYERDFEAENMTTTIYNGIVYEPYEQK